MKFIYKTGLDSIYLLLLCCILIYLLGTNHNVLNTKSKHDIPDNTSIKIIQIKTPGELTLTYYLTDNNLAKIQQLLKIPLAEIINGTKYYISPGTDNIYSIEPISGYHGISLGLKININKANLKDLTALPGVGVVTAENIIRYRIHNGNFERANDLLNVYGIGYRKFTKIEDLITVE